MPKGSLKRDDFLRKLADLAKSIPEPLAKSLGLAAVKASANYTYDLMYAFGEAGHVLRMILLIALRLQHSEKIAFLRECILSASDDTMAFRFRQSFAARFGELRVDEDGVARQNRFSKFYFIGAHEIANAAGGFGQFE